MLFGWALLASASFDYLLGTLFGLFATSKNSQIWAVLLGLTLSIYQTFYWRKNPLRRGWLRLTKFSRPMALVGRGCNRLGRLLHTVYSHLYQTTDVLFCIGLPMLVITALVGWWLIDEVVLSSMVLYLCLLLAISITGIYSNAVRMLSVGYFNGYWILSSDWLSYPFIAPMRLQQNIDLMVAEVGMAVLPVLGVVCLLLYLASSAATSVRELGVRQDHFLRRSLNVIETKLDRQVFSNMLFLGGVLLCIPLAFLCLNSLIDLLNIHLFFVGTAIGLMGFCWKAVLDDEPALSGDVQYLLSGLWRNQ
tara:strand:+ start:97 stop:1014 length:918 start_codon:yes stop_codon:yes gene_type:complete